MIFKPSEETPLGALKLAEIFIEAGMPAGVFNVVQGDGRVGAWLSQAPEVAKITFTGEVGTGKKVMRAAAETLKGVTMELGGKSPLIIFDDADLEEAVSAAMVANFYTQGEVCTNGTRVYVQQGIYPAFMARLLARTRDNIRVGDPWIRPPTSVPSSPASISARCSTISASARKRGQPCAVAGRRSGRPSHRMASSSPPPSSANVGTRCGFAVKRFSAP